MIDYTGQVALVTGAASGIGQALARALVARGAHVVLADVMGDAVAEAAAAIGPSAAAVACDIADSDAAGRLIANAHAWKGRLDLVCSNAGLGFNKTLRKVILDDRTDRLFEVNLFAAVRIAQAYIRTLEASGQHGRLLITGSENSLSVPAAVKGTGLGLYAASKHGVLILAEWLRDEMQATTGPIDVSILMPGAVYTPMVARGIPDPASAPPELGLIMPDRCAEIALKGLDLGLFYIPTHAHLADDMQPRLTGVSASLKALGLVP
jgi:NAD(P)-dependent dehydrogenase (short-subunit alcohol dehydrogenase family)